MSYQFDHFLTLNKFIDEGWMAMLNPMEYRVWLVFFRHANADGWSYPSARTVSEKSFMDIRNAERAIKSLIEKGLLELVVASRGGKGKTAVRRITFPSHTPVPHTPVRKSIANHTPVSDTPVSIDPNPGAETHQTPAPETTNPGAEAPQTPAPGAGGTIRTIQNNTATEESAAGEKVREERKNLLVELRACGIGEPSLTACVKVAGLTSLAVRLLAMESQEKAVVNPAGWIISKITSRSWSIPTRFRVEEVARMANEGHLEAVRGVPVTGRVTFSNHAVIVSGNMIDEKQLTPQSLRLRLPAASGGVHRAAVN